MLREYQYGLGEGSTFNPAQLAFKMYTSRSYPCQLGGLQLEGCSFDGNTLTENQRDSPSVSAIPTAEVAWVSKVSQFSHEFPL